MNYRQSLGSATFVGLVLCASFTVARGAQVTVTANPGSGNWASTSTWNGGVVPDNSAGTTYNVNIDGGNPVFSGAGIGMNGTPQSFTVDYVTIDAGDRLGLTAFNEVGQNGAAATLTVNNGMTNNGTVTFSGNNTLQKIVLGPNTSVLGAGTFIAPQNGAFASIATTGGNLTIGAHTNFITTFSGDLSVRAAGILDFAGAATSQSSIMGLFGSIVKNTGVIAAQGGFGQMSVGFSSGTFENWGFTSVDARDRFNVSANMIMEDGSVAEVKLGSTTGVSFDGYYKVTGDVDLSSSNDTLMLTKRANFNSSLNFLVMTYSGSLSGTFDHVTDGFALDYSTPGQIYARAVPEPSTMLGIVAIATIARRRRAR